MLVDLLMKTSMAAAFVHFIEVQPNFTFKENNSELQMTLPCCNYL
jgi:hypothetical protein